MSRGKRNNRGVTLIELMIALAILAMVMTAVIMMMSNNSVIYRKTKADINVQTTAQETYNALQDTIMQANTLVLTGYITGAESDIVTYQNGEEGANKDFSELAKIPAGKHFYPTKMVITYSVKSDIGSDGKYNSLDNMTCTATYYFKRYMRKADASDSAESPRCNIYVARTYSDSGYRQNDTWGDTSEPDPTNHDKYDDYLLTSSLSDIYFDVDPESQAISMDLTFNDKNMTYHTNGVVAVRNSYVMKAKRDRLSVSGGGSSDGSEETASTNADGWE